MVCWWRPRIRAVSLKVSNVYCVNFSRLIYVEFSIAPLIWPNESSLISACNSSAPSTSFGWFSLHFKQAVAGTPWTSLTFVQKVLGTEICTNLGIVAGSAFLTGAVSRVNCNVFFDYSNFLWISIKVFMCMRCRCRTTQINHRLFMKVHSIANASLIGGEAKDQKMKVYMLAFRWVANGAHRKTINSGFNDSIPANYCKVFRLKEHWHFWAPILIRRSAVNSQI